MDHPTTLLQQLHSQPQDEWKVPPINTCGSGCRPHPKLACNSSQPISPSSVPFFGKLAFLCEHSLLQTAVGEADDYLPKPFETRELVARIQAVLRRGERTESEGTVRIGALTVNWAARSVCLEGLDLALTTGEFELLGLLVRNRGRVLSRDKILDQTCIWRIVTVADLTGNRASKVSCVSQSEPIRLQ